MTILQLLAEWALRSSILILSGALLLWALRIKSAAFRLAAWTAMLGGSLVIPVLTAVLPAVPLAVVHRKTSLEAPVLTHGTPPPVTFDGNNDIAERRAAHKGLDWPLAAVGIYALVAGVLLMRLCTGLVMSLHFLNRSAATGRVRAGIEIRESDRVASPVTLGIVRPAIVLPADWREWDSAKLDMVLAHECSHIGRHDPAVQLLSAIHRALLWHSPLSWFLHQRIVRVAEDASDDAAVAMIGDRALYAEVLLDFMQRGVRKASWRGLNWDGVPMARYGRADMRIHRILDGTMLSRQVSRWSVVAILALGSSLACVVAAVHPQITQQTPPATVREPAGRPVVEALLTKTPAQHDTQGAAKSRSQSTVTYLESLGSVSAYTVTVKPRVDGQLMSVGFKEGDLVQTGQLLASIDPRPYQFRVAQAEGQIAKDQAQLIETRQANIPISGPQLDAQVAQVQGSIKTDQAKLDDAQLQLAYTQIRSPITGVAGLLLIDPGNMVHAADANGIVIINQLEPIAVLFAVSEDTLPRVLDRFREGTKLPVEAWSRDGKVKIATGHLAAVDNQIDTETGMVKLKAAFDNKDHALFPNQFVNVRFFLNK